MLKSEIALLSGAVLSVVAFGSCAAPVKAVAEIETPGFHTRGFIEFGGNHSSSTAPPSVYAATKPQPRTTIEVDPAPALWGQCLEVSRKNANGDRVTGNPVRVGDQPAVVEVPEGYGAMRMHFFPWTRTTTSASGGSGSHSYGQLPWSPGLIMAEQMPLGFSARLHAFSNHEAERRVEELEARFQSVLHGQDPGVLPSYVDEASFWRWGLNDDGWVRVQVAKRGMQVTAFDLSFNGAAGYATMGSGTTTTVVGEWVLVEALIDPHDLDMPSLLDSTASNSISFELATDRESAERISMSLKLEY